jgi:glyoxylase-like metal-dependent hydrolase (beta-lactamase superfamily II)
MSCWNVKLRFMRVSLEDNSGDVISKAARGLGMNPTGLERVTGIDVSRIHDVFDGEYDHGVAVRLAQKLDLHLSSLDELAKGKWYPAQVELEGLAMFTTPYPVPGYPEMTVNSYLVWDTVTQKAAAFDAGANVDAMLDTLRAKSLHLSAIFITHTHEDHIAALPQLLEATDNPPVWANSLEPLKGAELFKPGKVFSVGYLQVEACLTNGHSPGGTTYVISGLGLPVAVVGDALFCCSMGGAPQNYKEALQAIRREIFVLPDSTVLCPGHGPMTTVEEEKAHNPFFPEFKDQ